MNKYRKKPIEVEAIKTEKGMSTKKIEDFVDKRYLQIFNGTVIIITLEGAMEVTPGDYIIKGVKGEFYPCKPDIFEKTYEKVE